VFKPDLVITDIQMPRCDGLELMRHIRAHDPRIKAIYMSADLSRFRSTLEEERRRYNANLLAKPFSKVELIRLLPQHES
jgi:CheY-like chemotaxis protein